MFYGVYLITHKWDPETKKHIDMLIEDYSDQIFEIRIVNESLKQDLINLGKI